MPTITRLFLKSGLVYLILSIVIETAANIPGTSFYSYAVQLRPTAFHFFFVGWLTQMIFGVSHWFFPIVRGSHPRGNPILITTSFVALNLGLLLRLMSEAPFWQGIIPLREWFVVSSSIIQWVAFLAYAGHIWPRIKLKGH